MPAAKILRDHNYTKPEDKLHLPPKKQDPEITNKKLKSKIRKQNQQQLRKSKKKMTNMADITNDLQQNLIIKKLIK